MEDALEEGNALRHERVDAVEVGEAQQWMRSREVELDLDAVEKGKEEL